MILLGLLVALIVVACGDGAFKDPSTLCETNSSAEEEKMTNETDEAARERRRAERARIEPVIERYEALIQRQPGWNAYGAERLRDAHGERTGQMGIVIRVEKKVDQSTLPPEDRIPDRLEDIPVQIIEVGPERLD